MIKSSFMFVYLFSVVLSIYETQINHPENSKNSCLDVWNNCI